MKDRKFADFPAEVKMHVFSFLKPKALCTLELVDQETKALASDDAVWKAATGKAKEQFMLSRITLFSIFQFPREIGFNLSPLKEFRVESQKMASHIKGVDSSSLENFFWPKEISCEDYSQPNLLTNKDDGKRVKYEKTLYQALLNSEGGLSFNYFWFKFQLMVNNEIAILGCKSSLDSNAEFIPFEKPIVCKISNIKGFPEIPAELYKVAETASKQTPTNTGLTLFTSGESTGSSSNNPQKSSVVVEDRSPVKVHKTTSSCSIS